MCTVLSLSLRFSFRHRANHLIESFSGSPLCAAPSRSTERTLLGPTLDVTYTQRALATISTGVLRTIFRHSLPDTLASPLLELVDHEEDGGSQGTLHQESMGKPRLSCSSLRMCRYGGAAGVSFGEHTELVDLSVERGVSCHAFIEPAETPSTTTPTWRET